MQDPKRWTDRVRTMGSCEDILGPASLSNRLFVQKRKAFSNFALLVYACFTDDISYTLLVMFIHF